MSEDGRRQRCIDAFRAAQYRWHVEGTSQAPGGYGPPFSGPWFLIDTSTAEPEVGWAGALVAQDADNPKRLDEIRLGLVVDAVLAAAGETA